MEVRKFPRTRNEPRKRILLIPIVMIAGGLIMNALHPSLRFIGTVVSLAGALTVFLVGMVFADLWSSARQTRKMQEMRASNFGSPSDDLEADDLIGPDPFEESLDADD
jgi:hypothetical protein